MLIQNNTERVPMSEKTAIHQIFPGGGTRSSNLELFRIITMLVIIAHHYVVNSGLTSVIYESESLNVIDYFLLFLDVEEKQESTVSC